MPNLIKFYIYLYKFFLICYQFHYLRKMQIRQQPTNGSNSQSANVILLGSSNGLATAPNHNTIMGSNGIALSMNDPALSKCQTQKMGHHLANGSLSSARLAGPGLPQIASNSQPVERSQQKADHEAEHHPSMQRPFSQEIGRAEAPSSSQRGPDPSWFWRLGEEQRHKSILSMMGVQQESEAIPGIFSTLFNSLKTETRLGLQQIFKKVCDKTTSYKRYKYIQKYKIIKHVLRWIFAKSKVRLLKGCFKVDQVWTYMLNEL